MLKDPKDEPAILSETVDGWSPRSASWEKRASEERHIQAVADWLRALGMEVRTDEDGCDGVLGDLYAHFKYHEDNVEVMKSLRVSEGGVYLERPLTRLRRLASKVNRERRREERWARKHGGPSGPP